MKNKQKLLNVDRNAKTHKGQSRGYLTGILYLAPANLSGFNVCPTASEGCKAACLNTAGRGAFTTTQAARIKKTLSYFNDRLAFMAQLKKEIISLQNKADRQGFIPCVRLNGTSDIPWERMKFECFSGLTIMEYFNNVQFYDYTKRANRRELPDNYHLTFSLAEDNAGDAARVLARGDNVAVVYRKDIPNFDTIGDDARCMVFARVVDGTTHDLRFLDDRGEGVIVGLCAKGKARYDTSGFVREFDDMHRKV